MNLKVRGTFMNDVWEPELMKRINDFSHCKDKKYPELIEIGRWFEYMTTSKSKSIDHNIKFNR